MCTSSRLQFVQPELIQHEVRNIEAARDVSRFLDACLKDRLEEDAKIGEAACVS